MARTSQTAVGSRRSRGGTRKRLTSWRSCGRVTRAARGSPRRPTPRRRCPRATRSSWTKIAPLASSRGRTAAWIWDRSLRRWRFKSYSDFCFCLLRISRRSLELWKAKMIWFVCLECGAKSREQQQRTNGHCGGEKQGNARMGGSFEALGQPIKRFLFFWTVFRTKTPRFFCFVFFNCFW